LTEYVSCALEVTFFGRDGPEVVQSSGMESKMGEILEILSSWHRAAVEHALAKANGGNDNHGPVLKVRDRIDQSIIGLVLHSQGRPRMTRADG